MTANSYDPTTTPAWQKLKQLAQRAADIDIAALLARDEERHRALSVSCGGLFLDYAKNRVDDEILDALMALAQESPLAQLRDAMFRGEPINSTENRPVLHTALRTPQARLPEELADIGDAIATQRERMGAISDAIRSGAWRGAQGDAITDVVNLGIGGSDLGPRLACEALKEFAMPSLRVHFVANVDGEVIRSTLAALNAATTVVILCSKTFTTQETLLNAQYARHWLSAGLGLAEPFASNHFIAVTASPDNALGLGIRADNIVEFWDWVGGRYSLWSGVGLALAIAIGSDNFSAMLDGAAEMDAHFRSAPWRQNMPVILALLGIWYGNFLGAQTQAVIPYCERLLQLPFYLQQLDMESNGKSVGRDGTVLSHVTGPVLWGSTGTTGQHSFFQLLHQGSHLVPVDFIGVVRDPLSVPENHRVLLANMLAQGAALMRGKTAPDLPSHKHYPGNRPSNTLLLEALSPRNFGALLALYEHKVFVQGAIWNINSFDQWGVEFGKAIANQLLAEDAPPELDASTAALLRRIAQ